MPAKTGYTSHITQALCLESWLALNSEYEQHISLGFSSKKHKSLKCTRLGKMLLHNLIILIRHSAIDREACSASLLSSQGHQLSNVRKIVELVNSKPNISQKMKYTGCNFILIMEHEIKSRDYYLLLITRRVHKVEQKLLVLWESLKLMAVYHDSVILCLTSIFRR